MIKSLDTSLNTLVSVKLVGSEPTSVGANKEPFKSETDTLDAIE